MSGFEPGPGWREVPYVEYRDDALPAGQTATIRVGDQDPRYFIRDEPTPLPTEPYTVVRVTWVTGSPTGRILALGDDGLWTGRMSPASVADSITGFEVIAEPRAGAVKRAEESARRLTAKAVLERVREREAAFVADTRVLTEIAREFGVES